MGIKKFLHFERIKLVLPAALLIVFGLLIVLKPDVQGGDPLTYVFNGVLLRMNSIYAWYFLTPIHQAVYGTPFVDLPIFMVLLFVSGYLLSCAVFWIHRRNAAIHGRGQEVYYALVASVLVMFAAFYTSDIDALWSLIFSVLFGYILVTYAWRYYDSRKAGKIVRALKKERKRGAS